MAQWQSDMSIVILPSDKDRTIVFLNHEDYVQKYVDHISNDLYQLLPSSRMKAKTLEELKALKENKFSDSFIFIWNPLPRLYDQLKMHKSIASYSGSSLYNVNKYMLTLKMKRVKDENNYVKNSTTFSH